MSYELTFTRGFKDGLAALPHEIRPIVDRQLKRIQEDPFAKNPNATRMKNARHTFRVKIGIHVRMLYQVYSKQNRIELHGIGPRENFYAGRHGSATPLTPEETAAIRAEVQGASVKTVTKVSATERVVPSSPVPELPVTVEVMDWVTEDDLFLLQVPATLWATILKAGSIEGLQNCTVDASIKAQIEDYWTHPQPTQIEKLYALSAGQGVDAIAQQPLSHFLVALDPEQKEALQKIKRDGPYLLKGSAGTGKSLIGLYHIRDLVMARAGESLFDNTGAMFGVITYTNTLVDAGRVLLESITPTTAHPGIRCSTLDKWANKLAKEFLGKAPNPISSEGMAKWIREDVVPGLSADTADLVERLGAEFIADEIEQVIFGNGLETLSDYLLQERQGRKRGLREVERRGVWTIYEALMRLFDKRHAHSFKQLHLLALKYLQENPDYPRFAVLFVDEAQDFSKVARQLCLALVGDPRNLLLAADTGQSIYTVPPSWIKTDPRLDFRRRKPIMLRRSYRATREIGQAIAPLRLDPGDEDDRSDNANPVFSGPRPRWIEAPLSNHGEVVCQAILELIRSSTNPINPGQIAVIVRNASGANQFISALGSKGIPAYQVEKKSPLRVSGTHVHIVTAHSSKGLGFPIVFVPEVHCGNYPSRRATEKSRDAQQQAQIEDNEQRLLYVALSRASHRLFMVVDSAMPSPFVKLLDRKAHWD